MKFECVPSELLEGMAAKLRARSVKTKKSNAAVVQSESIVASEVEVDDPVLRDAINEARALLKRISPNRSDERDEWLRIGESLHYVHDSLLSDWITFSQRSPKFEPGECEKIWSKFNRNGGVTLGTLVHYASTDSPNDFEMTKFIRMQLANIVSLDEADSIRMVYEHCERHNKSFAVPMGDGPLLSMFNHQVTFEIKRRSLKDAPIGSDAIRLAASTVEEKQEEIASTLEPIEGEVLKKADDVNRLVDKVASKETLTQEEKDKAIRRLSRYSRFVSSVALAPDIEAFVSNWKLYIQKEMPAIYHLEYLDVKSGLHHRIELSAPELGSFKSVQTAIDSCGAPRMSLLLCKPWTQITSYLREKETVIEIDRERNLYSAIARAICNACFLSVHSIEDVKHSSINLPTRASTAFFEGDPKKVDAFWFDFDAMLQSVISDVVDVKVKRPELAAVLSMCHIKSTRTSRHWDMGRKRFMHVGEQQFKDLCHLAGIEFSMRSNVADIKVGTRTPDDDTSFEFTATKSLYPPDGPAAGYTTGF